jgi:hypothetical protein
MRSDLVILPQPDIDCDLSLFNVVELFKIKQLLSKCFVEALVISVRP